jgi:mono/diheme cytochrome c family protein
MRIPGLKLAILMLVAPCDPATAADDPFEGHIQPLLVEKCQSCHGAEKQKGGLRLDSGPALLKGGDSGPAIVPGKPDQSLLIQAVRRAGDLKMPPNGKQKDAGIDGRQSLPILNVPAGSCAMH